jgi:hypothetical protein
MGIHGLKKYIFENVKLERVNPEGLKDQNILFDASAFVNFIFKVSKVSLIQKSVYMHFI